MSEKVVILHETVLQSWLKDAGSLVMAVLMCAFGKWLDIDSLEWLGAVLALLTLIKISHKEHKKSTVTGAKAARCQLEKIIGGWGK